MSDNFEFNNLQLNNIIDDERDNDFIPLLTSEDEEQMNSENIRKFFLYCLCEILYCFREW
jgi:hypothetical protein